MHLTVKSNLFFAGPRAQSFSADQVQSTITDVQELNAQAERDQQALEGIYYPRLEEYNGLRHHLSDVLDHERGQLHEAVKDVEVFEAKLEYEINVLRGKVEDVEDGVTEFERQVVAVEDRVQELEGEMTGKESWSHWAWRTLTGLGRQPGAD